MLVRGTKSVTIVQHEEGLYTRRRVVVVQKEERL